MNRLTALIIGSCLTLCGPFAVEAKAGIDNKQTIMTTQMPIKIPNMNKVLPAGTYVIKLLDIPGTRNVVQISNDRQDKVYATVLAIPNYRSTPADEPEFTFWETRSGEPAALRSWFYPGDNYGVEFVYPRKAATEISRQGERDVPTLYAQSREPAALRTSQTGPTTPEGKDVELTQEAPSAPEAQKEQK